VQSLQQSTTFQLVSKHQGKLSKGIFILQDVAVLHKAVITHQKVADHHFELLKHHELLPSNHYFFHVQIHVFLISALNGGK
jgi:hypothetical protein